MNLLLLLKMADYSLVALPPTEAQLLWMKGPPVFDVLQEVLKISKMLGNYRDNNGKNSREPCWTIMMVLEELPILLCYTPKYQDGHLLLPHHHRSQLNSCWCRRLVLFVRRILRGLHRTQVRITRRRLWTLLVLESQPNMSKTKQTQFPQDRMRNGSKWGRLTGDTHLRTHTQYSSHYLDYWSLSGQTINKSVSPIGPSLIFSDSNVVLKREHIIHGTSIT